MRALPDADATTSATATTFLVYSPILAMCQHVFAVSDFLCILQHSLCISAYLWAFLVHVSRISCAFLRSFANVSYISAHFLRVLAHFCAFIVYFLCMGVYFLAHSYAFCVNSLRILRIYAFYFFLAGRAVRSPFLRLISLKRTLQKNLQKEI